MREGGGEGGVVTPGHFLAFSLSPSNYLVLRAQLRRRTSALLLHPISQP
jgi:hypothetical protein